MSRRRVFAFAFALGLGLAGAPGPARAQSAEECLAAHRDGQIARNEGALTKAHRLFSTCSAPTCPAILKTDCFEFLTKVEGDLPSLRIDVKPEPGKPLATTTVEVDGTAVSEPLDKPIRVDPGRHVVRIQVGAGTPVEREVTATKGDKNVLVVFELGREDRPTDGPKLGPTFVPPEPSPAPPERPRAHVSGLGIALGAASVLGLASFGTFAVLGRAKQNDLDGCKPHCASGDVDTMYTRYAIADVSLATAAVALVASGLVLFVFDSPRTRP